MLKHALAALLAASFSSTASAEAFPKTVSIIVATAVNTGHDIYARLTARYLGDHLPGKPTIVPKTMIGAAGRKAAEYMANQAPADGSEILAVPPETLLAPLYESQRYTLDSFAQLGSALAGRQLCLSAPDSPVKKFTDTDLRTVTFGATAIDGAPTSYALMIRNLTRRDPEKTKIVLGYPSTREIFNAMERGEVDAMCGIEWSSLVGAMPQWVYADHKANILLQTSPTAHAPLPVWGDVPDMRDFMSPEARRLAEFIVAQQGMSRPYVVPARTEASLAAVIREGLWSTWNDPRVQEEARNMKLDILPVSAEHVERIISTYASAPKELVANALKAQR